MHGPPSAIGKVRLEPPPKVRCLADVERAIAGVAKDIHTCRPRRFLADALANPAPVVASILDDHGLRDQTPGKICGRAADAENLSCETLIIRCRSRGGHLRESRGQHISDHRGRTSYWISRPPAVAGTKMRSRCAGSWYTGKSK